MLNFGENCRPLLTPADTAVTAYKISTYILFLVQNKSRTFAAVFKKFLEYGKKNKPLF